jgi:hypothetical protein
MKNPCEMDIGTMRNIPNFIQIGSSIQKLMGREGKRGTAWRSHTPTVLYVVLVRF